MLKQRPARYGRPGFFANTPLDAIFVAISLLGIGLYVVVACAFDSIRWPWLLILGLSSAYLICFNSECITHCHGHTPIFRSRLLNRMFSVINTLALGELVTVNHIFHLNHHRFVNDRIDPATGRTGDWTSSFRCGKDGQMEPFVPYVLAMVLRYRYMRKEMADVDTAFAAEVERLGCRTQIRIELIAHLLFLAALTWVSWRFFVFYYAPVWLIGSIGGWAFGYGEHYGATPGSPKTDSVSSYNPIYNFLFFNNGYHQEHHYRPGLHWTEIKSIKAAMLPADQRAVIRGWHFTNLGLMDRR